MNSTTRPCSMAMLLTTSTVTLLLTAVVAKAQFNYTTNNGAITITRYTGSGGAVTVPTAIDGLPVTAIGDASFGGSAGLTSVTMGEGILSIGFGAFWTCPRLTSVTIPNSVTNIGDYSFRACPNLTSVTMGTGITKISDCMFSDCYRLSSITIPSNVTSIGLSAFQSCYPLTTATIPDSVTNVEPFVFSSCYGLASITIGRGIHNVGKGWFESCGNLTRIFFTGKAPTVYSNEFFDLEATVYYLPGTTGWDAKFGHLPTALWQPQVQSSDPNFGVGTNGFGFTMIWASDMTVVVEANSDLAKPGWVPLATNTLSGDSSYFRDPHWTNYPARFCRVGWP